MATPLATVRWYPGPPVDDLTGGRLMRVEAGGRSYVVFAIGEDLYALADRCTHQDQSLTEVGMIDDGELECCAHGARFDPATGAAAGLPATKPLATARIRVRDGRIEIGLDDNPPERISSDY
jgi:nitrite reductase/ring-hydroxylating ferredoxin subunit